MDSESSTNLLPSTNSQINAKDGIAQDNVNVNDDEQPCSVNCIKDNDDGHEIKMVDKEAVCRIEMAEMNSLSESEIVERQPTSNSVSTEDRDHKSSQDQMDSISE